MALGNKKKSELKYHTDVEEFIPYAAHFDEETLVTKNGELMQVIKITGFQSEVLKDNKEEYKPLRALIREALQKNIKTDDYAIWIHTIRRGEDLSTEGTFENSLAKEINDKWIAANSLRTQFINELYITIIKEGENFPLKSPKVFLDNLFIDTEIKLRNASLINSLNALNKVTNGILSDLREFGARKLSVYKKEGIYYSEIVGLISKLMNLKQEDIPLAPCDLSSMLPTKIVSFQYNTVQVEAETRRHFGALYSLKEYREITLDELDKLIQLPVNIMITQSFYFVEKKAALEAFGEQKRIYNLSNSKYMSEISGINELFDEEADENIGFGEHQITITVLEDSVKSLQASTYMVVDALRDMGVYAVREDLFMENCYWSMMPANFDFLYRKTFIPYGRIAGLASLHNYITGKYSRNKWGPAVTTLLTEAGMPYFFNFHFNDTGHSVFCSGQQDEHIQLIKFLLCQSSKYSPRLFILDSMSQFKILVNALGGKFIDEGQKMDCTECSTFGIATKGSDLESIKSAISSVEDSMDGKTPYILLLDKGITSINDDSLSEFILNALDRFTEKNGIILFEASKELKENSRGVFREAVMEKIETKMFFPNIKADFNYKEIFKIKERELKAIKSLIEGKGQLILKRHNDSIVLKFDSEKISKILLALEDSPKNLELFNSLTQAHGKDWLKKYFSEMNV